MIKRLVVLSTALAITAVACAEPLASDLEEPMGSLDQPLATCPTFSGGQTLGTRKFSGSNEASGFAASRKNPGVLWTHDDSGDSARVFAMSYSGAHLGVFNVSGASFRDWEDIGLQRRSDGNWDLYLADIGGNSGRDRVQVYVVPEPTVSATQAPVTKTIGGTRRLELVYPDGEHNAEGLFVDPHDGAIYVVAKSYSGVTPIYRKSAPHADGTTTTLAKVAQIDFSKAPLFTTDEPGALAATAADISVDGDEIVVKTKKSTFLWRREAGVSVANAFRTAPCPIPTGQGEAVAFTPDGRDYLTTAEGAGSAIVRFNRR